MWKYVEKRKTNTLLFPIESSRSSLTKPPQNGCKTSVISGHVFIFPLPQTHATRQAMQVLFNFEASDVTESLLSDRLSEVKGA